ncbi:MAG: rhodanese-like domain-containing protein [Candidatus Sulfopaludibacter sp.]|nr:rhodanese-like domain-containing protein [Candidatus Sulfopaludibacter sp.]
MVLITSPQCRYCLASGDFHHKLAESARVNHVPLYIAVPSVRQASRYIQSVGLQGVIKSWADLSFGFSGTPTVVVVDKQNIVRATLVGKLPQEAENRLLGLLEHPQDLDTVSGLDGREVMSGEDLRILRGKQKVILIDVRERNDFAIWHEEAAVNIPLLEFEVRAPFELDRSATLVVDCSQFSSERCASVLGVVKRQGTIAVPFSEGLVFKSCESSPH